jgi:predicted nucleic acid-binding protein
MAANPVLPDSSFYIDCLQAGRDPLAALRLTAATRDLVVSPVVRCEVGRGIRNQKVLRRLHAAWDVLINVPTDARIWQDAERTLWKMDREGRQIPLSDAVIACSARRVAATVLTRDKHFRWIEGIRVIESLED